MKLSSFAGPCGLALTLGLVASSCDKKPADSSDDKATAGTGTDTDPAKTGTVSISTSALAEAIYPAGLNVTAFPTEKLDATKVGQVAVSTESAAAALKLLLQAPVGQPQGTLVCEQKYKVDATGYIFSVYDATKQAAANFDPSAPCTLVAVNGQNPPVQPPLQGDDSAGQNAQQKLQAEQEVLAGTATECLTDHALRLLTQPPQESNENCYQFDFGIMKGTSCQEPQEVCMVRTSRNLVDAGGAQIEGGLGIMQAMLCQAKKDGKGEVLPAIGESIDLASNLQTAVAGRDNAPTISVAKILRLADAGGKAVYKSTLTFKSKDGLSVDFNIAHSPTDASGTYSGVMWIKRSGGTNQPGSQQGADGQSVTSVQYSRTGEGSSAKLKMDIVFANLAGSLTPFTAEGSVKLPSNDIAGDANSTLSAIKRYSFDINPETSEGKLALWINPGGSLKERARGFIFDVAYDAESNSLKGCGLAGADQSSIRDAAAAARTLTPTGVYTPFVCRADSTSPGMQTAPKLWKQCFAQDADGVYVIDSAKTIDAHQYDYVPVADGGVTPPSITFTSLGNVNQ